MAAKVSAEAGDAGEKIFTVTMKDNGKKSDGKAAQKVQLKVGQMGIQLFDGPQLLDSFMYANLGAWEYKAGKRLLVLVVTSFGAGSGSPRTPKKGAPAGCEFGCTSTDGVEICKLMTDHATAMVQQKRSEIKQHLLDLQGGYRVTTPNGVLMRSERSAESVKIGIVAKDESLLIVEAVLTSARTRLHAMGTNVRMDDQSRQDVDGWVSLKSANGERLSTDSH